MKKIGMIVAVETAAVTKKFGGELSSVEAHGWDVQLLKTDDKEIYIVRSGAGEIAAASATQMLISDFGVELIVNFGVVGSLREDLRLNGACVVKDVVHYDFDTSAVDNIEVGRYLEYPSRYIPTTKELVEKTVELFPDILVVRDASGDKFIDGTENKRAIREEYQADICEMEAAAIVMTCDRNHVPNLLIKAVSDGSDGGADDYWATLEQASDTGLNILYTVLQHI